MDLDFDFEDPENDIEPAPPVLLSAQEMVDLFARKAKMRMDDLLRLKVEHVYDDRPGRDGATTATAHGEVKLKLFKTSQPYGGMDRFAQEDKVIGFVINPGLLPIVKAMTFAAQGRKVVASRKVAAAGERGAGADVAGYGIRVMVSFDAATNESTVAWEWLFGVL